MILNTIIAAPMDPRQRPVAMLVEQPRIDLLPDGAALPRQFKIKSADTFVRRSSANLLLRARYAWRGYQTIGLPSDQSANRITLTACEGEQTIGTITVGLDGPEGLASEEVFGAEVAALRADGRRIAEFTKLAIDPISGTKRVLAALFHVAYIVAHRIRGYDTLVMEVNPRHVKYYERMVGARVLGEQRLNRSVNAPAVLLTLDFEFCRTQIGEFGGQPEKASIERTIYPFVFSLSEEAGIITKMAAAHRPPTAALN